MTEKKTLPMYNVFQRYYVSFFFNVFSRYVVFMYKIPTVNTTVLLGAQRHFSSHLTWLVFNVKNN